jgi:hypothetical protein
MKVWQLIGATSLLVLSSWAVGDVYKWVDEKGVTHYGNQKPPEAKAEQVKVSGGGVSNSENPDPMEQLDPAAREMAEAMKKELLKDHGNAELNCSKAMTNATEQIDIYVAQAKRNLDGGYINQNQYDQVDNAFRQVKSRISTSRCQSASGIEKEFYLCMSNDMNSAVMCIDKAESIFK